MKTWVLAFFILFTSQMSQAFPIEELLGCYRTLSNNSYPTLKSEHFIEHVTKEPSRYLFDKNGERLPVLDFILGSHITAIDAHHGDWVFLDFKRLNPKTIQVNFDGPVQVLRSKKFEQSHVKQKLTITKIGKYKFKLVADQAILYGTIWDRSQQTWKIKRISCPWGWDPDPPQIK